MHSARADDPNAMPCAELLKRYVINAIIDDWIWEYPLSMPLIVMGDKTSHGGTVISCSPTCDTMGRGWARVGDMVACPRCKGVFPISQGDNSLTDDGRPVAYHGCKVACGASLISSQMMSLTTPTRSAAGSIAEDSPAKGYGSIATALIAGYQDEPADDMGQRFKGRFQVIDSTSGAPLAGQAVRVRSTSGQYITGHTDDQGFTEWIEHDVSEMLAFDLIDQGAE